MSAEKASEAPKVLRIERREGGAAVVWFDVPGEKVNTLRAGFERDFDRALDELDAMPDLEALVLASPKEDFIVGADVGMLARVETAAAGAELARTGQKVMRRLETFRVPIVAAIHGACLGGGLEIALACRGRVGSDDAKTKLGQPEVQLGLIPGAGGTQRLPRLVGLEAALDLILTGKTIPARKARSLWLLDEVVPRSILVDVALERARSLAREKPAGLAARIRGAIGEIDMEHLRALLLEDNPIGRKLLFSQARKGTLEQTHGNYPAPLRALEAIETGVARGLEKGFEAEAVAFGELLVGAESRRLVELFFAQNEVKKDRGTDDPAARARPIRKVGVLGAGLMGSGIATVTAAEAGLPVRMKDKDDPTVRAGLRSIRETLDDRVRRKRISERERDRVMALVRPTTDYSGFRRADVVIEAVFEDIEVKRRVLREVEEHAGAGVIFASNTSSLPIHRIAEGSRHPETVIGMHYFSPVQKMPLLEVIVTDRTAAAVTATCVELGKRQGKTVIVVRDGAGFYTSRILGPYGNEAAHLVTEGVPIEAIDRALVEFGFPVGPVKLLDEVGIDVASKVAHILHEAFGERMTPPPGLEKLVEDKRLGRKNGRGFYVYEAKGGAAKGERVVDESVYKLLGVKPKTKVEGKEIALRCVLQMVNEAARCYGEGILRSARDGDLGAVMGLGFPPFRGGPFRWADDRGAAEIVRLLEEYRGRFGARFEPAPVFVALVERGGRFYGEGAPRPGEAAASPRAARAHS